MLRPVLAFALLGLFPGPVPTAVAPPADSNGACTSSVSSGALWCSAKDGCTEGCTKLWVDTDEGPNTGQICTCDVVGPPPYCCTMLFYPASGWHGTWGECQSPGCPPNEGTCLAIPIFGMNAEIIAYVAVCDNHDDE